MHLEHMVAMDEDGLKHRAKAIEEERESMKEWGDFGASPQGKFMLKELRRILYHVRVAYSKIPAHNSISPILLAAVQGDESRVQSLISKLEDSNKAKLALDDELATVVTILQKKEASRRSAPNSLVAKEAIEENNRG